MKTLDQSKFALFSMNGLNLLIGFKGGIYNLDKAFFDFLQGESLPQDGMLEEIQRIEEREGEGLDVPPMPGRTLRALCLNITSNCNLNCSYCFAGSEQKINMTLETAKKAFDFLLSSSDPESTLQIDFFGGEPLLNFDLIKEFLPYAKSFGRDVKFTLTTNALLLNKDVIAFLNSEKISLIMSLDGDINTNDMHRKNHKGSSEWHSVLSNIKELISSREGADYYVRGTFTPDSLNIRDTALFYTENQIYRFSLEGAKGCSGDSWAISEKDTERIKQEYEKLAEFILEQRKIGAPIDYFHFNVYLDTPLCAPRRLSGCGAGVEYVSVSPKGHLYPCHQLHRDEFSMGSLDGGGSFFKEQREKFSNSSIYVKSGCMDCWARFYCSGGCHASSWLENGDINKPSEADCELQRHRVKCAVWLESMSRILNI